MSEIEISSRTASYSVRLAPISSLILDSYDFVVADKAVKRLLGNPRNYLLELETSESMKTMDTVQDICKAMLKLQLNRESKILAVGGGVIQDLVTMAASIYFRGITWTYVPTTLAAMADSCIGGKSSINLDRTKNVLGNFYPPSEIVISTEFLETLNINQKLAGLAEAIKINFARGPEALSEFLANPACFSPADNSQTASLVIATLRSKTWFIETDEFDQDQRQLLNFGHTFGHALESASAYRVPHGLAVAIGMLAAISFSGSGYSTKIEPLQKYCLWILSQTRDLNIITDQIDWAAFKSALGSDKKSTKNEIIFILPTEEGALKKVSLPRSEEVLEHAKLATLSALKDLHR